MLSTSSNHQVVQNLWQSFVKGDHIILNGQMRVYPYEDSAGKLKNRISIIAHKIFKLEKSPKNESSSSSSDSSDDGNDLDDVNRVQFSGNLVKDVYETKNFVLLNIASHYYDV